MSDSEASDEPSKKQYKRTKKPAVATVPGEQVTIDMKGKTALPFENIPVEQIQEATNLESIDAAFAKLARTAPWTATGTSKKAVLESLVRMTSLSSAVQSMLADLNAKREKLADIALSAVPDQTDAFVSNPTDKRVKAFKTQVDNDVHGVAFRRTVQQKETAVKFDLTDELLAKIIPGESKILSDVKADSKRLKPIQLQVLKEHMDAKRAQSVWKQAKAEAAGSQTKAPPVSYQQIVIVPFDTDELADLAPKKEQGEIKRPVPIKLDPKAEAGLPDLLKHLQSLSETKKPDHEGKSHGTKRKRQDSDSEASDSDSGKKTKQTPAKDKLYGVQEKKHKTEVPPSKRQKTVHQSEDSDDQEEDDDLDPQTRELNAQFLKTPLVPPKTASRPAKEADKPRETKEPSKPSKSSKDGEKVEKKPKDGDKAEKKPKDGDKAEKKPTDGDKAEKKPKDSKTEKKATKKPKDSDKSVKKVAKKPKKSKDSDSDENDSEESGSSDEEEDESESDQDQESDDESEESDDEDDQDDESSDSD